MAGGLHHVTARAPKGLLLFREDADRHAYLALLGREVRESAWSLRDYCLMSNHIHLLVMTPEVGLWEGMKRVHERFATLMHRTYQGYGHVFGARFFNKPVLSQQHEIATLRYIARNPVKAGICELPGDWPWSAYRALLGIDPAPAFLDVAAVRETLSLGAYAELCASSDARLLDQMEARSPETWMAEARDDFEIPMATLVDRLGVHRSNAYRRLASQRDKRDSPLCRGG